MTWENSVCMNIGRQLCPDVNSLVTEADRSTRSPIDIFYESTSEILTRIDPNYFHTYGEFITGLLLVGLISATENYFRDALGAILENCPVSQAHAADEKIQLGSLIWSRNDMHNRSAFEFMAFSNGENIKKTFKGFINYQIKQNSTWETMLKEYDKLCEFRHAIVHSGNIVAGKNAVKLGLNRTTKQLKVKITYALMQNAGAVCTSLVQTANNDLFELMVNRWAIDWRQLPSWDASKENKLLERIRSSFLSKRDATNKSISNAQTNPKFKIEVRTAFNL